MGLIKMTAEEAVQLAGKDAVVYVAVGKSRESVSDFVKWKFSDCETVIRQGNGIWHEVDELIDLLMILTKPHKDIALILLPPNN